MSSNFSESLKTALQNKGVEIANLTATKPASFGFKAPKLPCFSGGIPTPEERKKILEEFALFKGELASAMADAVQSFRNFYLLSEEERRFFESNLQEILDGINQMLSYDHKMARQEAVLAYGREMVRTCPVDRGSFQDLLESLKSAGLLQSGKGVRFYSEELVLTDEFARNMEAKAILRSIIDLYHRVQVAGKEFFDSELARLRQAVGENPLTVAEIPAGKPGRALLNVPDNTMPDGRVFRGGYLLVEIGSDRLIRPLDAAGWFASKVREVREMGVFLHPSQIGGRELRLNSRLPKEQFNALLLLWSWISSAIVAEEKKIAEEKRIAEVKALALGERDAMLAELGLAAEDLLSSEDFFLRQKAGMVHLSFLEFGKGLVFNWTYTDNDKKVNVSVPSPTAIVERRLDGAIRVAAYPARLGRFWAGCTEWKQAGEKFSGLGVLTVFLRIGWAKARAEHKEAPDPASTTEWEQVVEESAEEASGE